MKFIVMLSSPEAGSRCEHNKLPPSYFLSITKPIEVFLAGSKGPLRRLHRYYTMMVGVFPFGSRRHG